jgi:hypothetical protein
LVEKSPERVYDSAPPLLTAKKPPPLIARFRLLPVVSIEPCEKSCCVQIGEFGHGLLEARGVRIGDVVGYDVQTCLRGVDTTQSDAK